jgi:hypothetical protein
MPMRKEVLFAVIFGIILGAIILYGIQLANNSLSKINTNNSGTQTGTGSPTPSVSIVKDSLQIISPQDHAVITESTTTLRGTAKPASTVAVITESDDLIIETSPEGTFSAQINLIGGENTITATVLNPDKTTQYISITVIRTDNLPE